MGKLSTAIIATTDCPAYMRGFGWSSYGMGGFEGFHDWMTKAKKATGMSRFRIRRSKE